MTIEAIFSSDSRIVEADLTRIKSDAEISEYSIRHHLNQRLSDFGWNLTITPSDEGWPVYDSIVPPAIILFVREVQDAGVELGSDGAEYVVLTYIFGKSEAQRVRLAELIRKVFSRGVPIYNYVTGNETSPDPTGEYLESPVDSVGWQNIPHTYDAPDAERYRSVVTATLRRIE